MDKNGRNYIPIERERNGVSAITDPSEPAVSASSELARACSPFHYDRTRLAAHGIFPGNRACN